MALPPRRPAGQPIRVFLVDDSPLALVLLKRLLATSPEVEVVGAARSGLEALAAFAKTKPDVICTDYLMPELDGLGLIEKTMERYPRPILVISSAVDSSASSAAFPLLAAGAVDVLAKPRATDPFEETAALLVKKIKLLSGVAVISRRAPSTSATELITRTNTGNGHSSPVPPALKAGKMSIVCIGASTGGPQVLDTILGALPANYPYPVVCVQHISRGFLTGLVEWLNSRCKLRVKIAEQGETPQVGTIYFPMEETHLEVDKRGKLIASSGPPVDGHRPSVTVTFESVARYYGAGAVGVLLTGMGSDGAAGMAAIANSGGTTVAQSGDTCVVFGMPQQAIARGAAQHVLAPQAIAQFLTKAVTLS